MIVPVDIVQHVHRAIWDGTIYAPDPDRKDIWGNVVYVGSTPAGDCEEWADRAMDGLLAAGVPEDRIGVALCHTEGRENYDHAVCLVMVDDLGLMTCGDANDEHGPRQINATPYRFDRFMRLTEPGVWRLWNG